jgi:hypothetical protein
MKHHDGRTCTMLVAGLLVIGLLPGMAAAQESQSAAVARDLTALLDQQKLGSVAARDATQKDLYYAALYFQGSQLLVVSAKYSVPVLLDEKLAKKDYQEIYTDLNSASDPATKVFVMDLGADGLKATREENQPYDSFEEGAKRVVFDGDWKAQKLTEAEYTKAFADADAKYARILKVLLSQLKRTS